MESYIYHLLASPMSVQQGDTHRIAFKKSNKTVNYLIISKDGSLDWDQDSAEAGDALISPKVVRSDRVWLCELSPLYELEKQLEQLDAFLAIGDHVMITTDRIRDCALRYEHDHNLYYECFAFKPCPLQGVQATRVACVNLISDYINANQAHNMPFDQLLDECEATTSNTLWRSLSVIRDENIVPDFPLSALGGQLSQLCKDIAAARCADAGLAATTLLPIIAHPLLNCALNGSPINLFVLGTVETGGNKSTIQDFLKRPLVAYHEKLMEMYDPTPDENGIPSPPPFKNFFDGSRATMQGIIEQLNHDNCSLITAEAVSFFEGVGKEQAQQTASILCSMFSAEDTDTVLARVRTSVPARRRLNVCLLGQHIALDSFLTNDASIEIGLTARFLMYKHPQIDFNQPRPFQPLEDLLDNEFGGGAAGAYYRRMNDLLQKQLSVNVKLSSEAKSKLINLGTYYQLWLGDKSPQYTTDRIVRTFITRMAELVGRIACILYLYENDGDTLPAVYLDRAQVIVEYYYYMLKSLTSQQHTDDMYDKFLNALYERCKHTNEDLTVSQIQQAKLIRDPVDPNRRMKTAEIHEILTTLEDNGLIKLYPPRTGSKSKVVKLHPDWR